MTTQTSVGNQTLTPGAAEPPSPPAAPPAGAAPPAAPPTPPAAPEAKPEPPKATAAPGAPAPAATPDPKATEPRELGDDEDPDPKAKGSRYVLTAEAFRKRIERGTKQQLKEQFGTDDPAALKDKLKKLEDYESKAEEARLAQLTKEQKLEEEKAAAERRAQAAEERVQQQEYARQVDLEVGRVKGLMDGIIKTKFAKHVFQDLADHFVAKYGHDSSKYDAAGTDDEIKAWLTQYAKDNEEYAAAAPAAGAPGGAAAPPGGTAVPGASPQQAPAARPAAGNGVRSQAKPVPLPSGGGVQGKTPRPGQPNSMTQAEYNEYKRQNGIRY